MSPPERQWSPKSNEADSAGNRVKIADLLTSSAEDGSTAGAMSSKSASKTPVPFPRVPTIPTSEYSITVRQQPFAARSCGFGERDRRVIDPPPIVQLHVKMPGASDEEIKQKLRHPYSVVHCSIWNETGTVDYSAMPEDYRQQRRLMGTLVASPFVGVDENGEEGCFFCFPDLSCRTPGAFRLRFVLVVLDPATARPGSMNQIMSVAMSDVFTVFNAKDFPGMQASTALTKKLKEQGCLISIKKGNEKNGKGERESDDDDDEESRPRKKSKKA